MYYPAIRELIVRSSILPVQGSPEDDLGRMHISAGEKGKKMGEYWLVIGPRSRSWFHCVELLFLKRRALKNKNDYKHDTSSSSYLPVQPRKTTTDASRDDSLSSSELRKHSKRSHYFLTPFIFPKLRERIFA